MFNRSALIKFLIFLVIVSCLGCSVGVGLWFKKNASEKGEKNKMFGIVVNKYTLLSGFCFSCFIIFAIMLYQAYKSPPTASSTDAGLAYAPRNNAMGDAVATDRGLGGLTSMQNNSGTMTNNNSYFNNHESELTPVNYDVRGPSRD